MPPRRDNRVRVAEPPGKAFGRSAANARSSRSGEGRRSRSAPRRKPNRRPVDRTPLVLALVLLAILVGLSVWVLNDPRFDVKYVSVRGTQTIPSAEITGLVPVPAHRNLVLYYVMHHRRIASKVEKAESVVKTAAVTIEPPDTLVVTVTERQPYAVVGEGEGTFWVLDNTGMPFRESASRPADLPYAALAPNSLSLALGQRVSLNSTTPVGAFYQTLSLLSTPKLATLSKIREITVDQNANLCLNMSNNLQIRLGQPDGLAQKLALAAQALDENKSLQNAQYLDFTDPQRPAWKPRSPVVPVAPLPRDNAD